MTALPYSTTLNEYWAPVVERSEIQSRREEVKSLDV